MTDTENKNESTVICFAGPNGSGKSSAIIEVVEDYGLPPEAYINADDIATSLEGEIFDYRERNLRAAEIAEQRRLAALESGKDFAFETVMSTPEKVALLTQAKAKGYEVALIFVSTNDPEINVARVANRVALGGHAVDPDAVRDRYRRAHDLLACAVEHADAALVHDNSATNAQHVVVARKFEGEVQFGEHHGPLPFQADRAQADDPLFDLVTHAGIQDLYPLRLAEILHRNEGVQRGNVDSCDPLEVQQH